MWSEERLAEKNVEQAQRREKYRFEAAISNLMLLVHAVAEHIQIGSGCVGKKKKIKKLTECHADKELLERWGVAPSTNCNVTTEERRFADRGFPLVSDRLLKVGELMAKPSPQRRPFREAMVASITPKSALETKTYPISLAELTVSQLSYVSPQARHDTHPRTLNTNS